MFTKTIQKPMIGATRPVMSFVQVRDADVWRCALAPKEALTQHLESCLWTVV